MTRIVDGGPGYLVELLDTTDGLCPLQRLTLSSPLAA